jgi:hypothetical protein
VSKTIMLTDIMTGDEIELETSRIVQVRPAGPALQRRNGKLERHEPPRSSLSTISYLYEGRKNFWEVINVGQTVDEIAKRIELEETACLSEASWNDPAKASL